MTGSTDQQGPWLVKSGELVSGPFTTEALSQMVRDKEVVVIDEAMPPEGRWKYLRDIPVFQPLVEEIRRGLMHTQENTEVQGYTSSNPATAAPTPTPTPTPTQVSTATPVANRPGTQQGSHPTPNPDTNTGITMTETSPFIGSKPAIPITRAPSPPKKKKPDARVTDIELQTQEQRAATKSVMTPRDRTRDDQSPLKQPHAKKYARPQPGGRTSVYIGSAVLFLAAAFIIYTVMSKPQIGQQISGGTAGGLHGLETQASVAWKRGEFDRSLEMYRSLDHEKPNSPLIAARLATLMLKIEGRTVEAKRKIDSALPNAKTNEETEVLTLAKGLAALQSDDAREAADLFQNAGSTPISKFNEGVAQAALKNWPAAIAAFQKAGDRPEANLMLAKTYLNSVENQPANRTASRQQAEVAIKKAISGQPDFAQESLMLGAFLDLESGQKKAANQKILEAVETDPNQTGDHFHDPSLSLEALSWPRLLNYCKSIHESLGSHLSAGLLAICFAKANELEAASKTIDAELGKDPTNVHLHAINAYLQLTADREDTARASLTLSAKNGTSRLAQILNARLCVRDNQEACAEEAWSKLASDSKPPIAAIIGLAQVREEKGDHATANALLVKADSMSPSYLPLLRLREEASR